MIRVGIDDIAVHIPRLFLDMRAFAELRNANYDKLRRGLGLAGMAIPDVHEDTATMGANAVVRLIDRNGLDPRTIGRLYLGTESALDGAKPTATYVLEMLTAHYADQYGPDCFAHCDVVDLTFACIGAVDALHNTLDWVARGAEVEDRIGIVVFSDNAKYELHSTGEYTQGAGGGAVLVRKNPRLLEIPDVWGVSTRPVHDFYKPRRSVDVADVLRETLALAEASGATLPSDLLDRMLAELGTAPRTTGMFADGPTLALHKDTPVFDGPFSNRCYRQAVKVAFTNFQAKAERVGLHDPAVDPRLTERWERIILHLPYAFQGKRMFPDVFRHDREGTPTWAAIEAQIGPAPEREAFDSEALYEKASDQYRRLISKTDAFKQFVEQRIEKGQRASSWIGNQYTGSIFLALVSTLASDAAEGTDLAGAHIGFCGYGSGAKAKVFTGIVQPGWAEVAARFDLFARIEARVPLTAAQYESLHRGEPDASICDPSSEFALVEVTTDGPLHGQRRYCWVA